MTIQNYEKKNAAIRKQFVELKQKIGRAHV